MLIVNGLLQAAEQRPSSNCDLRPPPACIDLLVIHNISLPPGQYGSEDIELFFTNQLAVDKHPYFQTISHMKVSAHLLIRRGGGLVQFVPFHKRAWHAGKSCFAGKVDCNDYSIGIELEGSDDMPYELTQYQRLIDVTKALQNQYPFISQDRIVGHSDIAPGRKTDPGAKFDWDLFRKMLRSD